jgi:hypothetical protein
MANLKRNNVEGSIWVLSKQVPHEMGAAGQVQVRFIPEKKSVGVQ